MWKIILCRIGAVMYCNDDNDEALRLFEKTRIILYKATTLSHLYAAKRLIHKYEVLMQTNNCPMTMVQQHSELLKLWDIRYKIWKRG